VVLDPPALEDKTVAVEDTELRICFRQNKSHGRE